MDLKLVISLALCHLVWGRPQLDDDADLKEAISNLQLLNQIMIDDTLASSPLLVAGAAPRRPGPEGYTLQGNQKVYSSDGPFSDIPSDAFQLEHRKEMRIKDGNKGRVTKKDLNRNAHKHALTHTHTEVAKKVPENLIESCMKYFQGRSQPSPSSLELIVHICNELLDAEAVDDFALDDDKHQNVYEFRADDGATHHHHTADGVECECCPLGHHLAAAAPHARDAEGDARSDAMLADILSLFKPVGQRREWMVMNSKNPDERLRTYVDLKK